MGIWDRLTGRETKTQTEAIAALTKQVTALQEAQNDYYDPDANLSATGGGSRYFRRLSQSNRDLQPMDQERAQEFSYFLWETNPYGKRIINLTVDYCLGEGVTVESTAESEEDGDGPKDAQQKVIDRFWFDPVNRLDIKLFDKARELGIYGEQCYSVSVNPKDGLVRLGYIDPAVIVDVITQPGNAELAVAVKLRTSPGQPDIYYRIIHCDERPGSTTFGRLVGRETFTDGTPAETIFDPSRLDSGPIEFTGDCTYFAVNKVSNARRGRPDLLAVSDWVDGYDQFLMNEMERWILSKMYVFDVSLSGMDEQQIQEYAAKQQRPNPGSVLYHNDRATWTPLTPDLKAVDAAAGSDLLTGYVSVGVGLPKTWLSATEDVNKATATELGEPSFKSLTARQRLIKYLLETLITFVLDQSELAGALPRRPTEPGSRWPVPWAFQVQLPELRPKDMAASATTFTTMVSGLVAARQEMLIDEENARKLVVMVSGLMGVEIDIEQMEMALEKEQEEKDKEAALAPYPIGGGEDGQAMPDMQRGDDQGVRGTNGAPPQRTEPART